MLPWILGKVLISATQIKMPVYNGPLKDNPLSFVHSGAPYFDHVALLPCSISFMFCHFQCTLFSCCTLFMLHFFLVVLFFYIALFLYSTLFMLYTLFMLLFFPCCTIFMLLFFCIALFSCCFFRVALVSSCTFFVFYSFHVALS